MKIFSVFDSKAEAYNVPFFAPTTAVGVRMFKRAANDEGSDFCRHAEDYCLFELGEFNVETGVLEVLKSPRSLGLALSLKEVA